MKVKKIHRFKAEDIVWTSPNGIWQIGEITDLCTADGTRVGSCGVINNSRTDYAERYICIYSSGDIIYDEDTLRCGEHENIPKYVKTAVEKLYAETYYAYHMMMSGEDFDYCTKEDDYAHEARAYFTGKDRENNKFIN